MLFYAGWIEQWGGGTLRIIRSCLEGGLPPPEFEEKQGGLWVTFPKDFITRERLATLGLSERQMQSVFYIKEKGRITNSIYQTLCRVSKRTASEELKGLELNGVLERVGKTGKGTYYRLRGDKGAKGAIEGR